MTEDCAINQLHAPDQTDYRRRVDEENARRQRANDENRRMVASETLISDGSMADYWRKAANCARNELEAARVEVAERDNLRSAADHWRARADRAQNELAAAMAEVAALRNELENMQKLLWTMKGIGPQDIALDWPGHNNAPDVTDKAKPVPVGADHAAPGGKAFSGRVMQIGIRVP